MSPSVETVTVTSLAYGGDAVGHIDGKVVFIPGAVPGDELRVNVVKDKGSFFHGEIDKIVSPSPHRTEPFCPVAATCGGCQWQAVDDGTQRRWKETIVRESLLRISGTNACEVELCIPSPQDRGYRTVARYPAQVGEDGLEFGYYARKTHTITPIVDCPVASDPVNELASYLHEFFIGITPETDITELNLQVSRNETSALIGVTTKSELDLSGAAATMLADIPWLEGVVHRNGNPNKKAMYGNPYRYETIGGIRFRIAENSFFQINAEMAETLASLVTEMLDVGEKDIVVDGYGGVGLFSLSVAGNKNTVHLYDTSRSAVKDSGLNASNLGLSSFSAIKADTQAALGQIGRADKLILDPPRQGLGPKTVEAACGFGAHTIVYVSCNPATLARDLKSFIAAGYTLERVVPLDMFPHTYHIETVVKLVKS